MSTAFIFPGQGSQYQGMLKDITGVKVVFDIASRVLNLDLWQLAQFGSEEDLNNTVNTQPLLLTAGVALYRLWQEKPAFMAGHSLGEYTALVCSEAIGFEDAVRLVRERGRLMQEAVPAGQGAMAAILGMDETTLGAVCETAAQGEVVSPVNFNAIGQIVIAGHTQAVERACELAKEKGAKRALMLPVSVPSHCALMFDAAKKLGEFLETIKIVTPRIPIIHNVDVATHSHPDDIREALVKQLYCPVRWVESIQRLMQEGVHTMIECGPGKVLCGLVKRIDPTIEAISLEEALRG